MFLFLNLWLTPELYSYMHDIFGPDVMELFDLKYQPKLKAAEKEENSGGEKK